MDSLFQEFSKVQDRSNSVLSAGISEIDALISRLEALKKSTAMKSEPSEDPTTLFADVKKVNSKLQESGKEWTAGLTKLTKNVEKKFPSNLEPLFSAPASSSSHSNAFSPSLPFTSPLSVSALNSTLGYHFLRSGQFSLASTFIRETSAEVSPDLWPIFQRAHEILNKMDKGDFGEAIEFLEVFEVDEDDEVDEHGKMERIDLLWRIRRSEFVRLVLKRLCDGDKGAERMDEDEDDTRSWEKKLPGEPPMNLIAFMQDHLKPFYSTHEQEINQLLSSIIFTPLEKLLGSPYAHFYTPYLHLFKHPLILPSENTSDPDWELKQIFLELYCVEMGLARYPPLKVVCDVGNGSNVAKLIKARDVMTHNKNEWTQENELPVSLPLPIKYRFHSVFTCPISKEQATEANPPMMLPCGHVVVNESLLNMTKRNESNVLIAPLHLISGKPKGFISNLKLERILKISRLVRFSSLLSIA